MRKAERDLSPSAVGAGLFSRLRPRLKQPWLAPVASLATGLVVLLALFELQMNSLRGDNNTLQEQLASAGSDVAQIKQINAVLAAGDTTQLPLTARSAGLGAAAACDYHWSRGQRLGFVNCSNLEPLAAGQTYQAWLDEVDGSKSLGTCAPLDGRCQFSVDLSHISRRAEGIGLSVEPEGGSPEPTGNWVMYAGFAE
jgi:anti-sigma-K factor RskA